MSFCTKNPNLKKGKKIYFFVFCVGGGGVFFFFFFFFTTNRNLHSLSFFFFVFFLMGRGGGIEGVVWRGGSVARVSELFLQIIQVSKKKKQVSSS